MNISDYLEKMASGPSIEDFEDELSASIANTLPIVNEAYSKMKDRVDQLTVFLSRIVRDGRTQKETLATIAELRREYLKVLDSLYDLYQEQYELSLK